MCAAVLTFDQIFLFLYRQEELNENQNIHATAGSNLEWKRH